MKRIGKEKGGTSASGQQSWRELAGKRQGRIHSPQARKRRLGKLFRLIGLSLALVGCVALSAWGVVAFQRSDAELQIKTPSKPIENIQFETNGMLPNAWLSQVVELKLGMTMMEADIYGLKQKLEAHGQVKSAMVERVFPADLRIQIEEQVPVMRLAIADASGKRQMQIVGKDGTVYTGVGYPKATLQRLPYVLPYKHSSGSYFPMQGIERVAELLSYARQAYPNLVKDWQVVSLSHYSGDLDLPGQVIEIRSGSIPRIIFSASSEFGPQMDRLAYILEYIEKRGNPSLARIDLSLRGSAAVQFTSGRIGTF